MADKNFKPTLSQADGWEEWGNHVLLELKRLNEQNKQTATSLDVISSRLERLERVVWVFGKAKTVATMALGGVVVEVVKLLFF